MNKSLSRTEIRNQIRIARRDLSGLQQKQDADRLFARLIKHSRVQQAGKISVTLAYDGEIDTLRFVQWCWKNKKKIYLPVIHPFNKGHLLFLEYTTTTKMVLNRHGIYEPKLNKLDTCPMTDLDLIFTPLVAFDTQGNRIGMGGGYYDRMLAPWFKDKSGPYPIGLAHDCQQVAQLPVEEWDVPLPEIITPAMHFLW